MKVFHVRISVSPVPAGLAFNGRSFIDGTDAWLKKTCGGSCVGVATENEVTFELNAPSHEAVESMAESFCREWRKEQRNVQVVVVENPLKPLDRAALEIGAALRVISVKLTKVYFLGLKEGVFLVSHVMHRNGDPVFAESVSNTENRAEQWAKVRAAHVDQRACLVFPSEPRYRRWADQAFASIRARRDSRPR